MNLNNLNMSSYERVPSLPEHCYQPPNSPLELADRMIERFTSEDNALPQLIDKLNITCESGPTISGVQELEYSSSHHQTDVDGTHCINQFKLINKIPLPPEIVEQCGSIQGGHIMGMFPEINRAWLTIESDIYLWNFETGGDVAYFDGLSDRILSVGLVTPRRGIFQAFISHLLVLTTSLEITVLGVILAAPADKKAGDELQLTPDIIYSLSTDGVPLNVVKGTKCGRIFMGGRDGNLYELVYRKEMSWGGKRAWKVNHTKGVFGYLVPNFVSLAFSEDDQIADIAIDDSRNILFTLSMKGSIEVFDLGPKGDETSRVASLSHTSITRQSVELMRTVPYNEISKVVCLCALGEHDSPHIGVVAITDTGFRLYITTGSPSRPTTLSILHIRAPSGYAPGTPPMKPGIVNKALHKSGTFLMITTGNEMLADKVWCYSTDGLSVLKPSYTETILVNNISPSVALGEARTNVNLVDCGLQGHMLVYQQNYPQDRFIILTQQGTDIYEKMRPVDIYGELLREKGGPDCSEVKNFFCNQGSDQVCAMSLILACDQTGFNSQMAEWATRAFFLYGGEPKYGVQPITHQIQSPPSAVPSLHQTLLHHTLPPGFKPSTVSTPLGEKQQLPRTIETTYCVHFSSKHNGLYLFLSRLLRPVWLRKVVSVHESNKKIIYKPNTSKDIINKKAVQLYDLRNFLNRTHTQGSNDLGISLQPSADQTVISPTGQRSSRHQEAYLQEKSSLDALRSFVDHAAQVFSLWKVLIEHDFSLIIESLEKEYREHIYNVTFRDLILKGEDLCFNLINRLISLYLRDNASVDAISSKLREVCPALYKSEDATFSKVNEILQVAKDELDEEIKFNLLRSAIELCKSVSPNLNLEAVCKSLMSCGYYDGILEMCQDVANKSDPQSFASKYIVRGRPSEDVDGSKAFATRHAIYKEIVQLLDFLYQQCQVGGNNIPPLFVNTDISSEAQKLLERTLEKCLTIDDETCHIVVYDWLVAHELQASLVSLGRPSLERFLSRYPVDSPLRDLLWQYHEKSGNHAAAAQILYKLATTPGESISLHQRLTYLGKAVMCMRSDGVGCAPHLGVFLHELEDLVQVARVQKQIHDRISSIQDSSGNVIEACRKLNANLLSITELYESFAEPFGLWECKLSILDCAGHDDKELINSIWDNIITKELDQCVSRDPSDQMLVLMSKVKSLGQLFTVQSPCFPIEYLVWQLELISCKLGVDKFHVHSTMTSLGVPVMTLLDIYSKMYSANDRCWLDSDNEYHLIQVIASFAEAFSDNPQLVSSPQERKSIAIQMHDLINECITVLHSKTGSSELVSYLKWIQTKLDRI